jgi:hypothetical protein
MAALKILFISVCCLIAGAAGVSIVISGPASLPFSLLFAVFGWFYLFPLYVLVALMWLCCAGRIARMPWSMLFVLGGAALGGALMALLGEGARDMQTHDGLVLGGILAGGLSNLMVVLLKPPRADLGANGGPGAPLADSVGGEGPPSVS